MIKESIVQYLLVCFLFYCFLASCLNNEYGFIPEKHPSISELVYADYCEKLNESYAEKDYYLVAFYLANLKAHKKPIYNNLKKAVMNDASNCIKVFEICYLAEQGFYRHLYKIDTNSFKEVYEICLLQMGKDSYASYRHAEIESTKNHLRNREPLDSTLFDWVLIETLREIDKSDQMFRKKMRAINVSESEKERLFNLQIQIDSINLLRVDSILNTQGYPGKERVGYDYSSVIVTVIHHQRSSFIRQKYLDRIRKHISLEQIEMIEKRTQSIIQNN